jgi:hypothetical protein
MASSRSGVVDGRSDTVDRHVVVAEHGGRAIAPDDDGVTDGTELVWFGQMTIDRVGTIQSVPDPRNDPSERPRALH